MDNKAQSALGFYLGVIEWTVQVFAVREKAAGGFGRDRLGSCKYIWFETRGFQLGNTVHAFEMTYLAWVEERRRFYG